MSKLKKITILGVVLVVFGFTSLVFASEFSSPADIVARLTGKTVEEVTEEKIETGKTYGTLANESGNLTEFRSEMLEVKEDIIDERVKDGTITQEEANDIMTTIEQNIENCDGTGVNGIGSRQGVGFGHGMRNQDGSGRGFRNRY